MNAVQRHIEDTRKSCIDFVNASFDVLLEKLKENAGFLADMNATHDPGANYEVAYVATPAEIPTLEGIKPLTGIENHIEEVIERFGLEKESEAADEKKSIIDQLFDEQNKDEWAVVETGSGMFNNFCAWLINGEKDSGSPVTDARLFTAQETKKCKFTRKDFDHLQNLMWWRSELLKGKEGAFSLSTILSQNSTTDAEKPLWEALAKTVK